MNEENKLELHEEYISDNIDKDYLSEESESINSNREKNIYNKLTQYINKTNKKFYILET